MQILSFDIGIKNLAYCIVNFDDDNLKIKNIENWGIINLYKEEWTPEIHLQKCKYQIKNKNGVKTCNKCSSYFYIDSEGNREEYCKTHKKIVEKENKEIFPYSNCDLVCKVCSCKPTFFINECKLKRYGYCTKCKNKEKIKDYSRIKKESKKTDDEIFTILSDELSNPKFLNITDVILENQPALKNPRMKTIQVFIYSFFFLGKKNGVFQNLNNIILFSASKKLDALIFKLIEKKDENHENSNGVEIKEKNESELYKARKNNSIILTKKIIPEEWKSFFESNPKKDDLADSLMQLVTYLNKNKKMNNFEI